MTELASSSSQQDSPPDRADTVLTDAVRVAAAAADASGVKVRDVADLTDLSAVAELFASIWGRAQGPPVTPELLRAMSKAGSYIAAAFLDGRMVGACVGFHEEPALQTLHSHIAGVASGPWRHVGLALKLHQRAWAMHRGIIDIEWTFDPLVSRNAYFNITKLAARPTEYLANFYGNMSDDINCRDDTDRLLARWSLRAPAVIDVCAGVVHPADADAERQAGAVDVVTAAASGEPIAIDAPGGEGVFLVAVPTDIAALRRTDLALAGRWRVATRAAVEPLMRDGARIVGFDRRGVYILRRDTSDDPAPASATMRLGVEGVT